MSRAAGSIAPIITVAIGRRSAATAGGQRPAVRPPSPPHRLRPRDVGLGQPGAGDVPLCTKPLRRFDEAVLKQTSAINVPNSKTGSGAMIEAVTTILTLFSAGIFLAHAVDAYRAP